MPADIIIYALVATGLVFYLRSILGTRHEDDPKRPPSSMTGQPENKVEKSNIIEPTAFLTGQKPSTTAQERIMALAKKPMGVMSVDNKTAENALVDMAEHDPDFDIYSFLQGAQSAFAIIVEAFAAGDRETLENLLAAPVYKSFDQAIAEREKREEVQETKIHDILKAHVMEANLKNKTAFITVHFTAEETSLTKDSAGKILSGDPEKTSKMHDLWTFGRDIDSSDPRWMVYETRSDIDDDNDIIPNSD